MERLNDDGFITDSTMRLRRARDLIEQIKVDYAELKQLRKKVQDGEANRDERENGERLLSWLEQELDALQELQGSEIENVICAQIGQIENEIRCFCFHNILRQANRKDPT
jgi:hypothetical protein